MTSIPKLPLTEKNWIKKASLPWKGLHLVRSGFEEGAAKMWRRRNKEIERIIRQRDGHIAALEGIIQSLQISKQDLICADIIRQAQTSLKKFK